MGSGNEPAGQQAMTSERLAEIEHQQHQMAHDGHAKLSNELFLTVAVSDLLAEVERRRAREAALLAVVERVATMLYIPLTNASGVTTREICGGCARTFRRDDSGWFSEDSRHAPECVVEQARALLASTKADVGEQAAQGEQKGR